MTSKKELQLALTLAVVFLIVGVISYAAFPAKRPETPVRVMFEGGVTGKVLFDHKQHTDGSGYGLSCVDCHHHPEESESDPIACNACHLPKITSEELSPSCLECHPSEETEVSEAKSELSFEDIEGTEVIIRKDAYHQQCGGCHNDFDKGPLENDCFSCHLNKLK